MKELPFLTIALMLIASPARAEGTVTREVLDRCEAKLTACYETCKGRGTSPSTCDKSCTTDQCGLPWNESFGAFIDRRIEELAAPFDRKTNFTGLSKIKQ